MNTGHMKVPIGYLTRFGDEFLNADIYIKLGDDKFLKLTLKDEEFKDTIERYVQKGLNEVYLEEEAFRVIFNTIKSKLSTEQFFDPSSTPNQKVELLQASFNIAKEFLVKIGVEEEAIELCKNINSNALKMVRDQGNIFKFFSEFKANCSEEFLNSILVSHLTILMIDQFMWRSTSIKEKAALASLLCDMTLKAEDFASLNADLKAGNILQEHILKHPIQISAILGSKKNFISNETLTIIEQHHETQDGKGFPYKLKHNRITPLSAIFIVATQFIDGLVKTKFDYEKKTEILSEISAKNFLGVFGKAYDSLVAVVNT